MDKQQHNDELIEQWLKLRKELWPEYDHDLHVEDMKTIIEDDDQNVFFATEDDAIVGFLEASIRDFSEGGQEDVVGYLEGWHVTEEYRKKGIGTSMMEHFEHWAKEKGCTEVASDADVDDEEGIAIHEKLGFREVERVVLFRKEI